MSSCGCPRDASRMSWALGLGLGEVARTEDVLPLFWALLRKVVAGCYECARHAIPQHITLAELEHALS